MLKIITALSFFAVQFALIYWNVFGRHTVFVVILVGFVALFTLVPKFSKLKKAVRRDVLLINDEEKTDHDNSGGDDRNQRRS
ncbi:hypothetical protein ACIGHN_26880 [Acidovorax sp. NPDC077693]|uniref:hypothetical protein n=1 Tax=unclassified Acidovorax TaxID=2684926 RepID=UPI0037C5F254